MTIRCATQCENYSVDWDSDRKKVNVNLTENAKDSDIFIAAYENNVMKSCIMGDYENNEFDISEYVKNDYIIKIFVWDENQKPMGSVYEK